MVKSINYILYLRRNKPAKENKLILKAFKLAEKYHKNQKRASGRPYIEHLLEIAYDLHKWRRDYEVICAGILHDIVEDTEIKLQYIKKHFGKRVAMLVDGASWIRKRKDGKLKKDWPATYKKFCEIAKKDENMVLVKVADAKSNISEMSIPHKKEFMEKKAGPRNKTFWIPFFKEVGLKKFAKLLEKETNKYVKSKIPITLFNYINKDELKKIKEKLRKIEKIKELYERTKERCEAEIV